MKFVEKNGRNVVTEKLWKKLVYTLKMFTSLQLLMVLQKRIITTMLHFLLKERSMRSFHQNQQTQSQRSVKASIYIYIYIYIYKNTSQICIRSTWTVRDHKAQFILLVKIICIKRKEAVCVIFVIRMHSFLLIFLWFIYQNVDLDVILHGFMLQLLFIYFADASVLLK